jgi:ferrous iron transport protein A
MMINEEVVSIFAANDHISRMTKKLSELEQGESGIIHAFEKDDIYLKLMEMGCVPGEEVTVDTIAPLGDPISVRISGYHLSMRKEEAALIWVTTT